MFRKPLITLATDFGASSAYVAILKARLLALLPNAFIVDLDHNLASDDLFDAAFLLLRVYSYYPAGTVHLVGIDRGGPPDRALLAEAAGQTFLAMDNGVLGLVLEHQPEAAVRAVEIAQRSPFTARDVLAPLAARPSGSPCHDWTPMRLPCAESAPGGGWHVTVLHTDHFGNIMTSLRRAQAPDASPTLEGTRFLRHFGQVNPGELFCYWGAEDWLEIAVAGASAERRLHVGRGAELRLR